ncbi:MAG: hypothetical protein CGU29_05120 [Candidatus Dactylopiibacterium carminicum]|uniref:PEP-CTERM sorting domain-containing protein n=1 Tax=Candidatus Dactylopiibacterium carminicum TaxID=857335 RepID=A0A272EV94_9RHOO|nr:PEP-CTERM sorting domain-containing protein [Candidatus Dactylopiibacterium carminicum]KAF7600146.1 PEP-CTERM sorting domain-containing protein [Candidatus Dactylopiibacterium carminicum]PAS94025.1 MAG: hypothetical protein CGU29_05120 [Candidatus Dactylopiibacterium carminicum]PAT00145.1 MAG: hypothetical protein BSR46_04460 [Candidatus Dactylopiibacterium carminicum]
MQQDNPDDKRKRRRWLLLLLLLLSFGLGAGWWQVRRSLPATEVAGNGAPEPSRLATADGIVPDAVNLGEVRPDADAEARDRDAAKGVQRARTAARNGNKRSGPGADALAEALLAADPAGAGIPDGALPGSFAEGAPLLAAADPATPGGFAPEATPGALTSPCREPWRRQRWLHSGGRDPGYAPVPEPSTYLMLLAGLGLLTAVAKRRRQQA